MRSNTLQRTVKDIGTGIGVGLLAGLVGTAAITASQMIEMRITKRKPSNGPATAVQKTLDINPKPGTKKQMANRVHWVYGTLWGVVRGLLGVTGINCWAATGLHMGLVTGTGMAMAPLEGQNPVNEWDKQAIAIDVLHHTVYALAAGAVFDLVYNKGKR